MQTITQNRTTEAKKAFMKFLHSESTGGIILLICAVIALLFANIPALVPFTSIWDYNCGIEFGNFSLKMPLRLWINDGLMAIFFFVVGLEIKREMLVGGLSSAKKAALPVFAALGGMIFPAIIYAIFNHDNPDTSHGWGIPMATDIAFAIGVISLLGKRIPIGIKALITALAVADDLGAIIVLAIFYPTHALHLSFLLYAAIVVAIILILRKLGVYNKYLYVIAGVFLWYFIFQSGVHATIAGVILAITVPSRPKIDEDTYITKFSGMLERFKTTVKRDESPLANSEGVFIIHEMHKEVEKVDPLMHRFESKLHPFSTFLIMPLFALANAGVAFSGMDFSEGVPSLTLGIFFGLVIGKPLGIFILSFLSTKLKIAELPSGTSWPQIFAMGMLAGIGFTMSIFINGLVFHDPIFADEGKMTILISSFTAAILGSVALYLKTRKNKINNHNYEN